MNTCIHMYHVSVKKHAKYEFHKNVRKTTEPDAFFVNPLAQADAYYSIRIHIILYTRVRVLSVLKYIERILFDQYVKSNLYNILCL